MSLQKFVIYEPTRTKIRNFQLSLRNHNVGWLQVPVYDIFLPKINESTSELLEHFLRFLLGEHFCFRPRSKPQNFLQALLAQIEAVVAELPRSKYGFQLNDVRVHERPHDIQFVLYLFFILAIRWLYFDSNFFFTHCAVSENRAQLASVNFTELARAEVALPVLASMVVGERLLFLVL